MKKVMERKRKRCIRGERDEFVPMWICFYFLTMLLGILSEGSTVVKAQGGNLGATRIVPSVFNVSAKYVLYNSQGVKEDSEETVLAFGPGPLNHLELEKKQQQLDRMVHMTVPELIENGGKRYRWKEHTVFTEDNYILTIFQIRKSRECDMTVPILFMHDFLGSAADWLMVDPQDAIPFAMVDQGHEVWLLNARGNEYSNRHQYYKTSDHRFWNFSFNEQGIYDVSAVVKHVQKNTETQRNHPAHKRLVSFVGSGMGTTVFYVYLSKLGEDANDNILSFISVTPTAFLYRTTSPLKLLEPLANEYFPFQKDGPLIPELLANFLHHAVPDLCPLHVRRNISLCVAGGFLRSAEFSSDLNTRVMRRVFGHYPGTTSIRTLLHYIQLATKPKFKEFNFGLVKNFKMYQQFVPYQYNLFQASVTSFNLYARRDITVDYRDAERTTNEVSVTSSQSNFMTTGPYTHVDFMYGTVGIYILRSVVLISSRLGAYYRCLNKVLQFELDQFKELVKFCCLYTSELPSPSKDDDERCKQLLVEIEILPAEAQCSSTSHCGCPRQQHPFFTNNFVSA